MKPLSLRPPHVERLTARVRALDGPLIQLWAWPGAGQQAVLDALTADARFGQPLSLDALGDETSLRRAVEAAFAGGARWLVLPAVPSLPTASAESAGTIARLLAPGQRLVFSAPRKRLPGPLACSYLLPEELLLTADELAELWRGVTGTEPGEALVERLLTATDGWYRPLRLAAEAAAEAGGSVDVEAVADLPAVASFLRHEVLALLDGDERDLLIELAASAGLGAALWDAVLGEAQRSVHRRLVEEWGLVLEDPGGTGGRRGAAWVRSAGAGRGLRLPTLLRTFLGREREARWSLRRRRDLALRLGRAESDAGHPVSALEHLATAGEGVAGEGDAGDALGKDLNRLLHDHWPRLLEAAPLALLERATARGIAPEIGSPGAPHGAPGGAPETTSAVAPDIAPAEATQNLAPLGAARFLAALVEALLWRRPGALVSLAAAAAGPVPPRPAPAELAAAITLAAELLAAGPLPEEPAAPRLPVPPPLRPLRVVAELREAAELESEAAAAEAGEGSDAAALATLLVPALERVPPARRSRAARGGDLPRESFATPHHTALQALFEHGLLDLLRRRPSLAAELGRRGDLPAPWRRWLAGLPPVALASESSGFAVQLLGKPGVRLRRPGGRSVEVRFPLRRAFQVFAFLASSPGLEATRDELVEAVWHDEDEAAVEKNFHPTLSYVRRALEAGGEAEAPPVLLRRGVYRLNPRLAWSVDVAELERREEEGQRRLREGQPEQAVHLWQSAWALYRGPFLAGWDAPWIGARRDRLQQLQLRMLVALGEAFEGRGRLTEAMDAYRAALIEDSLQERVHLALMRIYARQGRRDLVRRQYERLATLLNEELGVEPLDETTESYHRLMA